MKRPYEALLAIRLKRSGALAGAIGWSHGDPDEDSFELGRVMVDAAVLQRHREDFPADYTGVAADAGTALRDFGFRVLGLAPIRCVFIDDNRLSRRAVLSGGGRIVGTSCMERADDTEVTVTKLELRRTEWAALLDRGEIVPAQPAMAASR
jgi:RimJ/RimL family protein N-acetyltransferase